MAANWNNLLSNIIGLNVATREAITAGQGITTIEEFAEMTVKDVEDFIKDIRKQAQVNNRANVLITFVQKKRLTSLRYWIDLRNWCGLTWEAQEFNDEEMEYGLDRTREIQEQEKSMKDVDRTAPEKLKTFKKWQTWFEGFDNYMQQIIGVCDIPINYVYREHKEVTDELREFEYDTKAEQLYNIIELDGDHYMLDNKRVWQELKPLICDGDGWAYIKRFEPTSNGRGAMLALMAQNEGENSPMIRKARAYNQIQEARYTGPKKHYPFSEYVARHQKAHNELEACDAPMEEETKVMHFTQGITDPSLQSAISTIFSNKTYMENFEECQQYITRLVTSTNVHKQGQRTREVAAVNQSERPQKKRKLEAKIYPKDEWKAMTEDEQSQVRALLRAKKNKGRRDRQQQKRKAAAAKKDGEDSDAKSTRSVSSLEKKANDKASDEPIDSEPKTTEKNAGNQFGRAAHQKSNNKKE